MRKKRKEVIMVMLRITVGKIPQNVSGTLWDTEVSTLYKISSFHKSSMAVSCPWLLPLSLLCSWNADYCCLQRKRGGEGDWLIGCLLATDHRLYENKPQSKTGCARQPHICTSTWSCSLTCTTTFMVSCQSLVSTKLPAQFSHHPEKTLHRGREGAKHIARL